MTPVLWLDEIREADAPRVGGKAASLARLRRAGLPVPEGFVLLAGEGLDPARRDALGAAYARLGGRVAVRSSSPAEDLAQASFAGQYRTILDVTGEAAVIEAVRACLASSGAARGYAQALAAPVTASMAVLVQRFVEPRAAGVCFTRHPHEPASLLIESHAGRGEELVSGRVTPSRHLVDRARRALRTQASDADGALQPALVAAVAALALRAEELLGGPLDVEWAVGADGPVLLQARPITVEAEDALPPSVRRLTRANVGEVLPDPVTPLTWTTLGAFLEHAFGAVAATAGLGGGAAGPFLLLHRQRLYLNLGAAVDVAGKLPGIRPSDAERLILGAGAAGAGEGSRGASPVALARVGWRLLRLASRLPGEVETALARVRRLPGAVAVDAADEATLASLWRQFAETGRFVATTHVATSGAAAVRLALLDQALARLAPGSVTERANRLLSGLEDVASTAPVEALEALAREAAARADWSDWLSRPSEELSQAFARGDVPPGLGEALAGLLELYGHRALSEGELRARTWRDDPTPMFAALRAFASSSHPGLYRRRARAEVRRADEEALFSRLGGLRAALLRGAVAQARRWVRERERTKAAAVAMMDHGRSLARASARRLVARRALGREDDVYFLRLGELLALLGDEAPAPGALARRRRRFELEGALPAPPEVDLEGEREAPEASLALDGIGVSAGVGVGPARVVGSGESPRLEPGEVLVAPVLDAALGPLLASAAGAVAEIGGLLSHGSVVARELGIPCVVDVPGATRRIRTGERILVDGGAGRVRPLSAEAPLAGDGPAACLTPVPPEAEVLHALEAHPTARESVYMNVQDPSAGVALVASLGVRRGGTGESLLALGLPDGRVLFGLDLGPAGTAPRELRVGPARASFAPVTLRFDGRLSAHEAPAFPPAPIPLLLAPRTVRVRLELQLVPTTPAFDFCEGLGEDVLAALAPLGRHHVEQSGRWEGELEVDGWRTRVSGTGSRDHSWSRRDWEAADHWRLFTVRLGDDLAVHALAVSARGKLVEGGFLWRDGRAERITRVEYATERRAGRVSGLELVVSSANAPPLRLTGTVARTIAVPLQLERSPLRHLEGRPYRLRLHENYTRYEAAGRVGHGMAEFTERPQR